VVVSDPAGVFSKPAEKQGTTPKNKPRVEEIPDDLTPSTTANTTPVRKDPPTVEEIPEDIAPTRPTQSATASAKPKVEEIPDDVIAVQRSDEWPVNDRPVSEPAPKPTSQPRAEKPAKPAKPKKEGPGFWERLGGAINQAITQQPQTGGTTQQPDGSCRGGSYWIGAPTTNRATGFQLPWSMPFGSGGHHWRVYRAGTSQHVTDNDQPANTNACGLSWHFYLPAGQYDIYLYPGSYANTRNTSTRPVVGPVRVFTQYGERFKGSNQRQQ
jgi:hypothetical protein